MSSKPIHRRTIQVEVFESDDLLTARARLTDERPWHTDPARVMLHDIELDLHLRPKDLVIVGVESRMNTYPHAECPLIGPRFERLVGISVRRGFTRALRENVAGIHGCAHLHEMARVAGPAIIQGMLSGHASRRPAAPAATAAPAFPTAPPNPAAADAPAAGGSAPADGADADRQVGVIAGTCHIWAPDGVGVRKLAAGWRPGTVPNPVPPVETFERDRPAPTTS